MSDPDQFNPYISNGTCYYMAGNRTHDSFLPCGNSALGHVHCCTRGDWCLEAGACFDDRYGTTYLAGCSDPTYQDPSCPDKRSYKDYPWAGLIRCEPNDWVACEETARPSIITKGDKCDCPTAATDTENVAFKTGEQIPPIGRLPTYLGGTISWVNGHFPTASTFLSTYSTTTTTPPVLTTEGSLVTPPSNSNLSTGAIVGIIVGSVLGAVLIFGVLSGVWIILRRRSSKGNTETNNPGGTTSGTSGLSDKGPSQSAPSTRAELEGWSSPSELPGNTLLQQPLASHPVLSTTTTLNFQHQALNTNTAQGSYQGQCQEKNPGQEPQSHYGRGEIYELPA